MSLPWLASEAEESVAALGKDFWRYGVKGNEPALNAFLRYHHAQGLSATPMAIAGVFAQERVQCRLIALDAIAPEILAQRRHRFFDFADQRGQRHLLMPARLLSMPIRPSNKARVRS